MSIKIYDAYEWKGGDLEKLLPRLFKMRKKIFDLAVVSALRRTNIEKFSMFKYADAIRNAIRSGQWDYHDKELDAFVDNPSASAVIYLYKGRIFVQFFGIPREYKRSYRGLADFHYQNQVFPPSYAGREIPEKEFNKRRRIWDTILLKDGRPSHSGLVFPFIEESDGLRIASEMYLRLHGHTTYPLPGDKAAAACQFCAKKRAEWEAEEAAKRAKKQEKAEA